jgi:AcrR family transcriptional regulator
MGRRARYRDDDILAAALSLVARGGPEAATVSAIAKEAGAPIGSIYHRFPSRDLILARLWLDIVKSFQEGFLSALARGDDLAAALYTPRWVREHLTEGRVLLLFRREELIAGERPDEMRERTAALAHELDEGMIEFVRRRFGSPTEDAIRTARFALIDVPYAAVRPHLLSGEAPPAIVDRLIEKTYRSIMGGTDENQKRP